MSVTCALFGPLREAAGRKHVEVDLDPPVVLTDVLAKLGEQCPELESTVVDVDTDTIAITVDGTNVKQRDGLETVVEEDEVVRLTPPIVGGCTGGRR